MKRSYKTNQLIKNVHIKTVHKNEKFKCDNCDKLFQSKLGLGSHKKSCQENKKVSTLAQIKEEKVTKDTPKDLVCFKCSLQFYKKSNFDLHQSLAHR